MLRLLTLFTWNWTKEMIDLSPQNMSVVIDILARLVPDEQCMAFGSRTNGTAKPYSDLDLVIMNEVPLDFHTLGSLYEEFAESDLPFRVDILQWSRLDGTFKDNIYPQLQKIR